jgi:hypothetical protein
VSAWVLVLALASAGSEDAVSRSKAAEARGFALVEKEQWCDAAHAFIEANAAAPSLDLIFNAALAADYADDRQKALKLYADLIGAYPGSERNAEVTARIAELTQKMGTDGVGTACTEPAPDEGAPIAESKSPSTTTSSTTETETKAADETGGTDVMAFVPWTMLASGAVVFVVGGALAVGGVIPYFGHAQARSAILDAEQSGGDASEAQAAQTMWRGAWETWGLASVVVGATTTVVGTLLGGAGGALGVADLATDEEALSPSSDAAPKTVTGIDVSTRVEQVRTVKR